MSCGWEAAVLEEAYRDHSQGWDYHLARLAPVRRDVPRGHAMSAAVDDALWSAVGDPTRRRMLDLLLAEDGGTATSLSARLTVTRQAVAKHLVVLDRAGLVHGVTAGREKQYQVDSAQLARAVAQLADVGADLGPAAPADQGDRRGDPGTGPQAGQGTETRAKPR